MFRLESSELSRFEGALHEAFRVKDEQVEKIVAHAALNVKKAVKADLAESDYWYFRDTPITYEIEKKFHEVTATVAPSKGRPGSVINFAFFGSKRGGGTHKFYEYAQPEFDTMIEEMRKVGVEI